MLAAEWRRAARDDLLAIVDHISDDNPDAAQRLKDDIEAKVSELTKHPKLYKLGRVAGTRELVAHKNYIIVYSETETTIVILRILHAAQFWPPVRT